MGRVCRKVYTDIERRIMQQLTINGYVKSKDPYLYYEQICFKRKTNQKLSQRELIFELLYKNGAEGKKTSLPELMNIAAQYNTRILELRMDYEIDNHSWTTESGQRRSEYWIRL